MAANRISGAARLARVARGTMLDPGFKRPGKACHARSCWSKLRPSVGSSMTKLARISRRFGCLYACAFRSRSGYGRWKVICNARRRRH